MELDEVNDCALCNTYLPIVATVTTFSWCNVHRMPSVITVIHTPGSWPAVTMFRQTAVVVELQSVDEGSCHPIVTYVCPGGYQPDPEPRPDLRGCDIFVTTKNPRGFVEGL